MAQRVLQNHFDGAVGVVAEDAGVAQVGDAAGYGGEETGEGAGVEVAGVKGVAEGEGGAGEKL